jgi:hypothetical protein
VDSAVVRMGTLVRVVLTFCRCDWLKNMHFQLQREQAREGRASPAWARSRGEPQFLMYALSKRYPQRAALSALIWSRRGRLSRH